MKKHPLNVIDDKALTSLLNENKEPLRSNIPYNQWIQILRSYYRMTQSELAERAKVPQSYIVSIESGKKDIQLSTLKKIFSALSCDLILTPQPHKPLPEILRGRAQTVALNRLKQSMGSMALEGQSPEAELFQQLLEKKTDEILNDRREKLRNKPNAR